MFASKMKRTGIGRELDKLGRVKIRYELCKAFGIEDNTTRLELLVMSGFIQVQEKLNDQKLLASYFKAIELKLDKDFILILEEEVKRRALPFITKTDRGN
ncbi:sporulation histidine kinase inhibitor Sda [Priestia aryabhattai]|uniref:sporulation histidine kinase inhibitor Sda n=1 Tax=Priestia aryabhattai TaxID=412384 RepID=UPI00387383A4